MSFIKLLFFIVAIIISLHSCSRVDYEEKESLYNLDSPLSSPSMLYVDLPLEKVFKGDDLSRQSLLSAVESSISYFQKIKPETSFPYGALKYTAREVLNSLNLFKSYLYRNLDYSELLKVMEEEFLVFQSASNFNKDVMFTGYYEPIFRGSLRRTRTYNIPVYTKPKDLEVLDLGRFRPTLRSRTIVYRKTKGGPTPYYSRREIMGKNVLRGKNYEIAWLKSPVDLFFLQVQGSGIMVLPNGEKLKLSYNGSNGRKYSSIGKYIIDKGWMKLEDVSMGSIREFLSQNPTMRNRILYHNESYVFFKMGNHVEGPKGNINVPLTSRRSIATDARIFPKGALAYIITDVPSFNRSHQYQNEKPIARFVMNQDTGGAIKGTGRVDLFWGNGKTAEKSAGRMRSHGKIYFIIAKKDVLKEKISELSFKNPSQ